MNARVEAIAETPEVPKQREILVIQTGPLADCVQSVGALQAIRAHHAGARICLLTTPEFAEFCGAGRTLRTKSGRPKSRVGGTRAIGCRRQGASARWPMSASTTWTVGPAHGGSGVTCAAPNGCRRWRVPATSSNASATRWHDAGVGGVPLADLGWVEADISEFGLIGPFVLFVLAETGPSRRQLAGLQICGAGPPAASRGG